MFWQLTRLHQAESLLTPRVLQHTGLQIRSTRPSFTPLASPTSSSLSLPSPSPSPSFPTALLLVTIVIGVVISPVLITVITI